MATDRCYGCKTCSIACAREHLLEYDVLLRRVRQIDTTNPVGHAFVSMSCNHCDEPACVANCPSGAYSKDEDSGLVLLDESKCIGSRTCIDACPFNAPTFDETNGVARKCDGCITRQEAGLLPVCNIVCPSLNITLGDFDTFVGRFTNSVSIKEVVPDVMPNLLVSLDPDITADIFVDIDGFAGTVDTGNGMFSA